LERDIIRVQSVRSEELEKGIGYVRLASFNESAAKDVQQAIRKLEEKAGGPLKGLVLDLRMNPGGLLDQAVDVSSLFIDEGTIVSTMGRDTKQREVRLAKRGIARKDFALAVLVNGSSASAAEIVAGAIQDHGRGLILGAPTFGKGSVQTVVELGGDLGLKLTVARYYTPNGRSIQEKGVTPDIVLDEFDPKLLSEAKVRRDGIRERDLKRRIRNTQGESESADETGDDRKGEATSKATANRIVPKEDFQVREAVSYLKAFEVFRRMNRPTGEKTPAPEGAKTHAG
jgi:carboxyl-terminal processing protease